MHERGGSSERRPVTDDDTARETAKGLIQGYIVPDHKALDMNALLAALVQELKEARSDDGTG